MNYKKLMASIIITIVILTIITGCGYSREEKAQMRAYEKQAAENAITYIENKYGFTPTLKNVQCEKYYSPSIFFYYLFNNPSITGDVYIEADDGERSFNIYISGKEETGYGFDNYQFNDIKNDVEMLINNTLKIQSISYTLRYGKFYSTSSSSNGLITEYYDGTNLTSISENCEFYIISEYIGIEFDGLHNFKIDNLPQEFITELENAKVFLVSYRSNEAYDTIADKIDQEYIRNIVRSDSNQQLDDYRILINEYVKISDNATEYYKFELNQIDDIYYILDDGTYAYLTKTEISGDLDWEYHYTNGSEIINGKQIYNAYLLETDATKIYLYIPIDKLKSSSNNIDWITQYYDNNVEKHYILNDEIIGKSYLSATINIYNMENIIITVYEFKTKSLFFPLFQIHQQYRNIRW